MTYRVCSKSKLDSEFESDLLDELDALIDDEIDCNTGKVKHKLSIAKDLVDLYTNYLKEKSND